MNENIKSIAYGNGVYIAAAGDCILRSTDCENWIIVKQRDSSYNNNHMTKVVYGDGTFLICGESSRYITSDFGATWTEGKTASFMDCAAFGEGKFLLSSSVHPGTLLVDAVTFAITWVDYSESMSDLAYCNNQFVGVKNSTADKNIYTLDLTTNQWNAHPVNFPALTRSEKQLRSAGDKLYLGFNDVTKGVDENWGLSDVQSGYLVDAVQLDGNIFLLTEKKFYQGSRLEAESPYDPYCCMAAGGEDGNVHLFTVGGTHTAYQPVQYVNEYDIKEIAYGNGIYMAAAGDKILKSTDGQNWTLAKKTVANPPAKADVSRIAYGGGNFLACGTGRCYMTANDGATWSDFGYGSLMENVSYGNGSFLITCSASAGGTFKIDAATFSRTSVCYESMGETVFVNNGFYGVKPLSDTDQGLYKLIDSYWMKICDNIGTGERCLRASNGRLLLGVNGSTYEFVKNTAGEFASLALLPDVRGQMVDACGMDGETYILSYARFYQGTLTAHAFEEGRYRCITPGKFAKMNVSAPTSCILLSDGGSCAVYEPVEPVDEYRIRSVSFNDGVYIAATSDRVLKSFDGHHWFSVKKLVRPDRTELKKVVLGDGKFLVCGQYDYFISSDNGLSWYEDSSFHAMEYAAYGNGKFITTSSQGWAQQIDTATLERTALESLELVDDVACWNGRFVAVKNDVSDRNIYVLTSDNIWEAHELINCPALTKAEKTLRVVNGVAYLGVNNSTKEIGFNREGYQLYDIAIDEFLVDSCEVDFNSYLLTSSTLFENDYPVQTVPSGRVFVCCTAGQVVASALTRAANSGTNGAIPYSDPASGDGNSDAGGYAAGSTPPPAKTGTVTYSVVTDTHNSPSGITSATFDLGDNTLAYEQGGPDPISYPNAKLMVYGNHDVEYLGYVPKPQSDGDWIWRDSKNHVAAFGLNSCLDQHQFEIPLDEIQKLAYKLYSLGPDWDVIILTHVPLFDGDAEVSGTCWNGTKPVNTDGLNYPQTTLLPLLKAYHNHGIWNNYNFSGRIGRVIGCFSGHVHNGLIYTLDGIYMEAFTTNGSETVIPTQQAGQESYNAGLYSMYAYPTDIKIDFTNKTVNGYSYVSPAPVYKCLYKTHPTDRTPANKAKGFLSLDGSYPKFKEDGTYLGYSSTPEGGPVKNPYSTKLGNLWNLGVNTSIYVNGTSRYTAKRLFFTGNGTLAYYYNGNATDSSTQLTSTDFKTIDYRNNTVHFYANGFRWTFKNGKYVFDKTLSYNFSNNSSSYPAFDPAGYYIGWAGSRNGVVTSYRKNESEDPNGSATRSWQLGDGKGAHFRVNGSLKLHPVTNIVFDGNGKLDHFYPEDYKVYTSDKQGDGLDKTVTFITEYGTQILKWTFKNRLFNKVEVMSSSSITGSPYTCGDEWMNFTNQAYYMKFDKGYLKQYRKPGESFTSADIDDPLGWSCGQKAYYYNSLEDVCLNNYISTKAISKLYFTSAGSSGYYINAEGLGLNYAYASIRGYIFKQEKLGLGKWLLYKMSYPNMA